jgi:adenylosuccinate lyase
VERVILPDAAVLLNYMIHRMKDVLQGLQVYPERMKANMEKTSEIVCSQRLVIALTRKGLAKQKAYELVQKHALEAWTKGVRFRQAVLSDPRIAARLSEPEIEECFSLSRFTKNIGGVIERSVK